MIKVRKPTKEEIKINGENFPVTIVFGGDKRMFTKNAFEELKKLVNNFVLDDVIVGERICEVTGEKCDCEGMCVEAHT
jgi:hypothetical protein